MMKTTLSQCSKIPSPIRLCGLALLSAFLIAPVGCDEDDTYELDDIELDEADDEVAFRGFTSSRGFGSRRLNTARLGDYLTADAKRDGDMHPDPTTGMRTYLRAIKLADTGETVDFMQHPLNIDDGWMAIGQERLSTKNIIGATLVYRFIHPISGQLDINATITGFATMQTDAGELPMYNIKWNQADWEALMGDPNWFGEGSPDKGPELCDTAIDAKKWPFKAFTEHDGGPNYFKFDHAVVLYKDITLDPDNEGLIYKLDKHVHFACASAATGKSALWGFPAWISDDQIRNMTGHQQLQANIHVIRAAYTASESYTADGTPMQVVNRHVNTFDEPNAPTEAVWDKDGHAICVSSQRVANSYQDNVVACDASHEGLVASGKAFAWTKLEDAPQPPAPLGNQPCSQTSNSPGCNDIGIETYICSQSGGNDPYCCNTAWDGICVNAANQNLGQAACTAHNPAVPGCGHDAVEQCVCDADPYCCNTNWDGLCVNQVTSLNCGVCP